MAEAHPGSPADPVVPPAPTSDRGGRRFTLTFSDGGCLPALRRIIRGMLAGADTTRLEAAELVCTELVANALDHAAPPRAVSLAVDDTGRLEIVVVDGSPDADPVPGRSRLGGHRGHGMTVVDRLATSWWVTHDATTKAVRAVIG